jgi:hypothetical protein
MTPFGKQKIINFQHEVLSKIAHDLFKRQNLISLFSIPCKVSVSCQTPWLSWEVAQPGNTRNALNEKTFIAELLERWSGRTQSIIICNGAYFSCNLQCRSAVKRCEIGKLVHVFLMNYLQIKRSLLINISQY